MLYENLGINEKGHLTFAGWDTVDLAKVYGTALMVLDEERIRQRCRVYKAAMEEAFPAGSRPLYASKALSFKGLYRLMAQEDMGIDVVSVGEICTAAESGFPMENAFFHGNSKSDSAICYAMDRRVGWFVCDNADELAAISREAESRGICQKVLLRVTPGIDPHTHEKINTGRIDSKFGAAIETGQAEALVRLALKMPGVDLKGYHCHIGSQIFEDTPFREAAVLMLEFAARMQNAFGYYPEVLNLGGGMAVRYQDTDPEIDYAANIRGIGQTVMETCARLGVAVPAIFMEPGRSIVADAGITLYTVSGTKEIPGYLNYAAVDGGMTDNPRYALYNAPYTVLPASKMEENRAKAYTVAGWCCESGDILQENVFLPEMARGDILAVLTTGAYNYSMASNYNRMPRPAVLMIGKDGPYTAIRREMPEDVIQYDE